LQHSAQVVGPPRLLLARKFKLRLFDLFLALTHGFIFNFSAAAAPSAAADPAATTAAAAAPTTTTTSRPAAAGRNGVSIGLAIAGVAGIFPAL
jgi:hypothetical protein